MHTGFDGGDLVAGPTQLRDSGGGVVKGGPANAFLRA
jgi:hypothetical protein